jgi:hypothetical protein
MLEIKDDPGLIFSVDGHGDIHTIGEDIYTINGANCPNSSISINSSMTSPSTWTTGVLGSNIAPWFTNSSNGPSGTSARINLTGDEADIEVNGWSLVDAVKRIEERLCLFQPNPELEQEWEDLRELGEQYRALETKLKEQSNMWAKLKAMPAPDIE